MLKDQLYTYTKEVYPMHMPGHKGGRYKLLEDMYALDVTEVDGTDHLYKPEGILEESMDRMSEFYGTNKTFFLVNGSTVGILSAVGGIHEQGDAILVARNCHQSVYNAVAINRLSPTYIYPKTSLWGMPGGIDPEAVKHLLAANPKIVSFIMTSPTYDGFISDVTAIAKICERYNVVLIVDEAHGAHLPLSKEFPASAIECGAHIVIHSMHKTLPAITGTGLIHLNLPKDMEKAVLDHLAIVQTSSPSYIMMANIDACVQTLGNNEKLWKKWLSHVSKLNKSLKKMKGLCIVTDYASEESGVIAMDPLKSLIVTTSVEEDGIHLSQRLREVYNIQMEMADINHILGIMTIADSKKALKAYGSALKDLDKNCEKLEDIAFEVVPEMSVPMVMDPWQGLKGDKKYIEIEKAVNCIAGALVTPYPPGIPVIVPGEQYTEEVVKRLIQWQQAGKEVIGMENMRVIVHSS